jgi:hypothetical protein
MVRNIGIWSGDIGRLVGSDMGDWGIIFLLLLILIIE